MTGFARSGHDPARERKWRLFKVRFLKPDMQESTPFRSSKQSFELPNAYIELIEQGSAGICDV
jgi:hypothetical protein